MNIKSLILALGVLGLSGGFVFAHEGHDHGKIVDAKQAAAEVTNKKAVEVGNKICPVSGDKMPAPGEKGTMGDDKPVKYPAIFAKSKVLLINKIDMLAATSQVDFDIERVKNDARKLNKNIEIFPISARTGEGMSIWYDWLERQLNNLG